mmetsp:Transcript_419/g.1429  ORF Transcript_419/g.1429 Transcript_419/m.1429 type:complete len:208 (+) Transcript_419:137-760(+)
MASRIHGLASRLRSATRMAQLYMRNPVSPGLRSWTTRLYALQAHARQAFFASRPSHTGNWLLALVGRRVNHAPWAGQAYGYLRSLRGDFFVRREAHGLLMCLGQVNGATGITLRSDSRLATVYNELVLSSTELQTALQIPSTGPQQLQEVGSASECVVCMDRPNSVAYSCGHRVVCEICDNRLQETSTGGRCPYCRSLITLRTYRRC